MMIFEKLSKGNKTIFLFGDRNISLLNYDTHPPAIVFLDLHSSHYFLPHILQPTRLNSNLEAITDNIFCNMAVLNIVSGKLTASISDHLPQFLVVLNIFFNSFFPKSKKYKETGQEKI